MNGFLIAAPQSGSGKTTVSLALMACLKRQGVRIAPFKCGPDFIDSGYHQWVTGVPSINLDGWMCPASFVRETFMLHSADSEIAIIEGVMGLFDGMGASTATGSSAQIAAITGVPVVLVVNAQGMAGSAAALVSGFARHDPQVRVAGVIFNNVGSEGHGNLLRQAMTSALPEMPVFGCIPRDESVAVPSRHLGLVAVEDNPLPPAFIERLADLAERHLDLYGLMKLESSAEFPPKGITSPTVPPAGKQIRIAVARDAAFSFIYEDNLRLLKESGAEMVYFSPLADERLPTDITGIYLPGGYPELYSAQLAANHAMKNAVRGAVKNRMPVYAECGGLIYLTQAVEGTGTGPDELVGVYPVRARMLPKRKALGYREVELLADVLVGRSGSTLRGHEFHYSEITDMPGSIHRCYRVLRQGAELGTEGYGSGNCLASYIHLHFGSNPEIAPNFVAACAAYRSMLQDKTHLLPV